MKKLLSIIGALAIALTGFGYVYAQQTSGSWITIIKSSPNYLQTVYDPDSPLVRLPLGDPLDPLPAIYVNAFDALTANIALLASGDIKIKNITPSLLFEDTDATDGDDNASIDVNCTDCGSGTEDVNMSFKVQEAGVLTEKVRIDADLGIVFTDAIRMENNAPVNFEDSSTGGWSVLGTRSSRAGGYYLTDQGWYNVAGDSDGNGNHYWNFISGGNVGKDHGNNTFAPDPTYCYFSSTDPDVDDQENGCITHDQTDLVINTEAGDIVLDPIGGFVNVDGGVVESVSAVQSLDAGDQVALTDGAIRFAGNAGAVTLTSTPHLPDGTYDNECHTLWGTNDTNTLTLKDESVLAGSGVHLGGNADFVMGNGANIEVCWNATNSDWWAKGTRVIN